MSPENDPPAGGTVDPREWRLRAPLTHRVVVTAALAYIDEHGLGDLTMRRLGDSLGVEAMALYRYVRNKEQLLNDVAVMLVECMHLDASVWVVPGGDWQGVVRGAAHAVRRSAIAHPGAFPLVVSTKPEAAWLRPPLASLDWAELFMRRLSVGGLSDEACVQTYQAVTSLLVGHLLTEVHARHVDNPRGDAPHLSVNGVSRRTHPVLSNLQPLLSEHRFAFEFEEALEALIAHIEGSLAR